MKKSEAVQLIMDTFEFQGLGTEMREKDAWSILEALVRAGMLPPERGVRMDGRFGQTMVVRLTEWEAE